jgi:hypothetical protein
MSEDHFHLGVDFAEPGWIRMMAFDGGGAFLPKRTTGATSENWKVEPSSFLGSGPSSSAEKMNGIREGAKWSQEEILNYW